MIELLLRRFLGKGISTTERSNKLDQAYIAWAVIGPFIYMTVYILCGASPLGEIVFWAHLSAMLMGATCLAGLNMPLGNRVGIVVIYLLCMGVVLALYSAILMFSQHISD